MLGPQTLVTCTFAEVRYLFLLLSYSYARVLYRLQTKGEGKVKLITGYEGTEGEYRYGSALSLTPAIDGGRYLTPRPGSFTSGQDIRYP